MKRNPLSQNYNTIGKAIGKAIVVKKSILKDMAPERKTSLHPIQFFKAFFQIQYLHLILTKGTSPEDKSIIYQIQFKSKVLVV